MLEGKIDFRKKEIKVEKILEEEYIKNEEDITPSHGAVFTSTCGLFKFDFIKKVDGRIEMITSYLL